MYYPDIEETPTKELPPLYQYYFRVILSFSASAAIIGNGLSRSHELSLNTLFIAFLLLSYCGLNYGLVVKKKLLYIDTTWVAICDGFIISLAIADLDYNPLPSALLLMLMHFNALSQGGIKQWLGINFGTLFGLLIGFFLFNNQHIDYQNNSTLNTVILIGAFAYLCLYGAYSFNYQQQLNKSNHDLQLDSKQYRKHAYKLSRYLPGPVTAILKGEGDEVKTERKRITVFFSDIVGFTDLSEELEAESLTELLNSYLSEMSKIANQFNGTVDKFIGDAIMILFGDDIQSSQGVKKDAIQCAAMAIAMRKRMQELQPQWLEMGIKKPLQIRIGINSGYCTVGTFGTNKNLDYTALGVHVNLASRLESAGQPGNILVSHETWALIKDVILCRDKGQIKAKGFSYPIHVYEVIDLRKDLGNSQSYLSESLDGFSLHLDLEKVKNYDREKVVDRLKLAINKLSDKNSP